MNIIPVAFRNAELLIFDENGEPYIPMRQIVEGMGLDWKSQHRKLTSEKLRWSVVIMTTVAQDGKSRESLCIPLKKLFGWMVTVSPNKVKPEIRDNIIAYQNECDEVLWQHWMNRHDKQLTDEAGKTISDLEFSLRIVTEQINEARKTIFKRNPTWQEAEAMFDDYVKPSVIDEYFGRYKGWTTNLIKRLERLGARHPHNTCCNQGGMAFKAADKRMKDYGAPPEQLKLTYGVHQWI